MAAMPASLAYVARIEDQRRCQARKEMVKATYALDLLAALDGTSRARLARLEVDRSSGREHGESSDGESGEAREHHRGLRGEWGVVGES